MASSQNVALVTGASKGIGAAAESALVKAGYAVVGTSRSASKAEPIEGVTFIDLDVASESSVQTAIAHVMSVYGRIDVLVNNAGIGSSGAAEESSTEQAQQIFDINVFGVIRLTNAVLPIMRAQRSGRIVNLSSVLGIIPQPYMAVYAATKHAIEGYSESSTMSSASSVCASRWSSRPTRTPPSRPTVCGPTSRCRSTPSDAVCSRRSWQTP